MSEAEEADTAKFIYRDIEAEMSQLKRLTPERQVELIEDLERLLYDYKLRALDALAADVLP